MQRTTDNTMANRKRNKRQTIIYKRLHKRGWSEPISWFYFVTFLCLSPVRTWISNVIYVVVRFVFSEFRGEVIVRYLDGINNHNYLFKISFNNRS